MHFLGCNCSCFENFPLLALLSIYCVRHDANAPYGMHFSRALQSFVRFPSALPLRDRFRRSGCLALFDWPTHTPCVMVCVWPGFWLGPVSAVWAGKFMGSTARRQTNPSARFSSAHHNGCISPSQGKLAPSLLRCLLFRALATTLALESTLCPFASWGTLL